MTDKVQKIKKEIKNQIDSVKEDTRFSEPYKEGLIAAYQTIKAFINSLPKEHNEDLEEAAKDYGIRQGVELKPFAVKYFKAGAEWQKKQMMKDAVEGTIKYEIGSAEIPQCDKHYQVLSDQVHIPNAKLGDKVKIIIVKED